MQQTLNDQYQVNPVWKLRLKYYAGFGTYLEAYSTTKRCWINVKRVSLINIGG